MDRAPEKVEGIDRFLLVFTAVVVDIAQFAVTFVPFVGPLLASLVGLGAYFIFWVLFEIVGLSSHGARFILQRVAPLITETIPLINLLPSYTIIIGAVIYLHNKHVEERLRDEGNEAGYNDWTRRMPYVED